MTVMYNLVNYNGYAPEVFCKQTGHTLLMALREREESMPNSARNFQTSVCSMTTNIPLAETSHLVTLKTEKNVLFCGKDWKVNIGKRK
jgi:hypothetical protein